MIVAILLAMASPMPMKASDARLVARRAMAQFMHCSFKTQGYKLRSYALAPMGRALNWGRYATSSCLQGAVGEQIALAFAPDLMRGAVFEEMYRADFGKAGETSFEGVPALTYAVEGSPDAPAIVTYRNAMALADCAVRRDPVAARNLILSEVGESEEQTAMRDYTPALSVCLDQGKSFALNLSTGRNIIAEALYRLTSAKRDMTNANS